MGKHFALTLQLPNYRREVRAVKKPAAISGFKAEHIGAAILVLLAGSVLAYLVQVNTFSTKGYEISKLQNQIQSLQDEHNKLEVQAAQAQSIQRIQNDPAVLNMAPISTMTYVQNTSLSER